VAREGEGPIREESRLDSTGGKQRQRLVQVSAERLRQLVLEREPGAQIGSLRSLAAELGVGIVTVQQAARVLEHEGLLMVRRGPGGGYYGARPDEAALGRLLGAWLSARGSDTDEALELVTLLEGELNAAASHCRDPALLEALRRLIGHLDICATTAMRIAFEEDLHSLLFQMTRRPLIELLSRVTLRHYSHKPRPPIFATEEDVTIWRTGRRRILLAVLAHDETLARFEANRHRDETLRRLRAMMAKGDWP
jgi:DNA-binding FadR family transcriptional regulator